MSTEFTVNKEDDVILITIINTVSVEELKWIRSKTIELLNETGIKNYIVDLSAVTSILEQKTISMYQLGKEFQEIKFPYNTKTAVILPTDDEAREQAKFLHTVEINRMRGPLRYVSSYEEALGWFNS
jgi:hypothetical protein